MSISDVTSVASTVIALGALGWAIRADRRARSAAAGADTARDRAGEALKQAAAALSRSSIADEQSAEALTKLASLGSHTAVRWSLDHWHGDTYRLVNVGNASAFDVALEAGQRRTIGDLSSDLLKPDEHLLFVASQAGMGARQDATVQWRDKPDGEKFARALAFPPRPPR